MLYSDWINGVCTLLEVPISNAASASPATDSNFNLIYPRAIEYAELRLQRDLDFINTVVTDPTGNLTANGRTFSLPTDQGTWVVVQQVTIFVGGVRQQPMIPVSREMLDWTYPAEAAPTTPSYPTYWCPNNGVSVLVGPGPDQAYQAEVVGTIRIKPLSAANTSNFLSVNLPDMYLSASMVFLSAYQRDFGAQSSDPQMAVSWESTYTKQLAGASVEELRKKFRSIGQSARIPSPIASTPGN